MKKQGGAAATIMATKKISRTLTQQLIANYKLQDSLEKKLKDNKAAKKLARKQHKELINALIRQDFEERWEAKRQRKLKKFADRKDEKQKRKAFEAKKEAERKRHKQAAKKLIAEESKRRKDKKKK